MHAGMSTAASSLRSIPIGKTPLGPPQAEEGSVMKTVWIYVDTRYHVGHPDRIEAFAIPKPRSGGSRRTIPKAWHSNMG
jgi:hypothetical protein